MVKRDRFGRDVKKFRDYQQNYMREYRKHHKRKIQEMTEGSEAWEYHEARLYVLHKGYQCRMLNFSQESKEVLIQDSLPDHLEPLINDLSEELTWVEPDIIRHWIHEFLSGPKEERQSHMRWDRIAGIIQYQRWERDKRVHEAKEWVALHFRNTRLDRLEGGRKCMKMLENEGNFSYYCADKACRERFRIEEWPNNLEFSVIEKWRDREAERTEKLENLEKQYDEYWDNLSETLVEFADSAEVLVRAGKSDDEIMELLKDTEANRYHGLSKLRDLVERVIRPKIEGEKWHTLNKQIIQYIIEGCTDVQIMNTVSDLTILNPNQLREHIHIQRQKWYKIFAEAKPTIRKLVIKV